MSAGIGSKSGTLCITIGTTSADAALDHRLDPRIIRVNPLSLSDTQSYRYRIVSEGPARSIHLQCRPKCHLPDSGIRYSRG